MIRLSEHEWKTLFQTMKEDIEEFTSGDWPPTQKEYLEELSRRCGRGVSEASILNQLKRRKELDRALKQAGGWRLLTYLTAKQSISCLERYENGEDVEDIAKDFGIHVQTVRVHIRAQRKGIKLRQAKSRPPQYVHSADKPQIVDVTDLNEILNINPNTMSLTTMADVERCKVIEVKLIDIADKAMSLGEALETVRKAKRVEMEKILAMLA